MGINMRSERKIYLGPDPKDSSLVAGWAGGLEDLSSSGLTLIPSGGTLAHSDIFGDGWKFNGASNLVTAGTYTASALGTYVVWYSATALVAGYQYLMSFASNGPYLLLSSGVLWGGMTSHNAVSVGDTRDGLFHLAVVTITASGSVILYRDGDPVATVDTGVINPNGAIHLGQVFSGGNKFTGVIKTAYVHNEIKSPDWIKYQWNRAHRAVRYFQPAEPQPTDDSVVAEWLGPVRGGKVTDVSSNNLDATAYGGVISNSDGGWVFNGNVGCRLETSATTKGGPPCTYISWFKCNIGAAVSTVLVVRGPWEMSLGLISGGKLRGGTYNHYASGSTDLRDGLEHMACVTVTATGATVLYLDENPIAVNDDGITAQTLKPFYVGALNSTQYSFDGVIETTVIDGEVKSPEWVKAQYRKGPRRDVPAIQKGTYVGPCWIPGISQYVSSGTVVVETELINGKYEVVARTTAGSEMYLYPEGCLNGLIGPSSETAVPWKFRHFVGGDTTYYLMGEGANTCQFSISSVGVVSVIQSGVGNLTVWNSGAPASWSDWEISIDKNSSGYRWTVRRDGVLLANPDTGINPTARISGVTPIQDGMRISSSVSAKLQLTGFTKHLTWLVVPPVYAATFSTTDTTQEWTVNAVAGVGFDFDWGDGIGVHYVSNGVNQVINHNYAGAGTYTIKFNIDNAHALQRFYCHTNSLTGSIPNMSGNPLHTVQFQVNLLTGSIPDLSGSPTLEYFYCDSNQLTGSIPDLSSLTLLQAFTCEDNQLTGSIPSLSSNSALTRFLCGLNQLTGSIPDLSSNPALHTFWGATNQLTGSIPSLSSNPALVYFSCDTSLITGSIPDLSGNVVLEYFWCFSNSLTGYTASTLASALTSFDASVNDLDLAAVDQILTDFTTGAAGRPAAGDIDLSGGTNAAPTPATLAACVAALPGWTITTN